MNQENSNPDSVSISAGATTSSVSTDNSFCITIGTAATWNSNAWSYSYSKVDCPVCGNNVCVNDMMTYLSTTNEAFPGSQKELWRGCTGCVAKALIEHPRRLAALEQKVNELSSKLRLS